MRCDVPVLKRNKARSACQVSHVAHRYPVDLHLAFPSLHKSMTLDSVEHVLHVFKLPVIVIALLFPPVNRLLLNENDVGVNKYLVLCWQGVEIQ